MHFLTHTVSNHCIHSSNVALHHQLPLQDTDKEDEDPSKQVCTRAHSTAGSGMTSQNAKTHCLQMQNTDKEDEDEEENDDKQKPSQQQKGRGYTPFKLVLKRGAVAPASSSKKHKV